MPHQPAQSTPQPKCSRRLNLEGSNVCSWPLPGGQGPRDSRDPDEHSSPGCDDPQETLGSRNRTTPAPPTTTPKPVTTPRIEHPGCDRRSRPGIGSPDQNLRIDIFQEGDPHHIFYGFQARSAQSPSAARSWPGIASMSSRWATAWSMEGSRSE